MWNKLKFGVLVLVINLACISPSQARLNIDVTLWLNNATPIAIVPFGYEGAGNKPEQMTKVISGDLRRSGHFSPMPVKNMVETPHEGNQVKYATWRNLKMKYLVVGKIQMLSNNKYQVQFQLMDVDQGQQMIGQSFQVEGKSLRRLAHHISDLIYKAVTGIRGAFDTYLAYVTVVKNKKGGNTYKLNISDSDGYNEQTLLTSSMPILRPVWSPDAQKLAYVSYISGTPQIYIQNIYTMHVQQLTHFKGSNLSPAWSPNGKRMAMSLSKDGNAEIYIMNLATHKLVRITNNYAIDVEPTWTPDGKNLIFTSDRGGKPQLYEVAVGADGAQGTPQRITFDGDQNLRADVSPDGKSVAMVNETAGKYRIAVMDLETGQMTILSNGNLDDSPSYAPNGTMIIYSTHRSDKGVLAIVSSDGRARQLLRFTQGSVRQPAWSPYLSDQ